MKTCSILVSFPVLWGGRELVKRRGEEGGKGREEERRDKKYGERNKIERNEAERIKEKGKKKRKREKEKKRKREKEKGGGGRWNRKATQEYNTGQGVYRTTLE